MTFGPKNDAEALVYAVEELRADIQYEILRQLKLSGITRAQLAGRMGVSPAAVSGYLDDEANLTLETVAKIFLALGVQARLSTSKCGEHYGDAQLANISSHWEEVEYEEVVAESWEVGAGKLVLSAIQRATLRRRPEMSQSNDNGDSFYQTSKPKVA